MRTVLSQDQIDILYRIFAEFNTVASELQLPYSLAAGSALGAVRHKGLIPWDDDGDLYVRNDIFQAKILAIWMACIKRGLRIQIHTLDGHPAYGWYKLYWKEHAIPNVDIFTMTCMNDGNWHLTNPCASEWWPKEVITNAQWSSLSDTEFGPLTLPLIGSPEIYLRQVYGYDWNTIAWDGYDHVNEKMRVPRANARRIDSYDPALPSADFMSIM